MAGKGIFLFSKGIYSAKKRIIALKGADSMKKFENLDGLLAGSETAKIFFTSLPDYVQGAALRNSGNIFTEEELHRFAEKTMHEFN